MPARKGVVIEKGKGWAIILLPNGEFKRVKTSQYLEIGELYQEANLLPVKYVAAAVILLTMLFASIDYYSVKAYAQVSSLAELGVNRWGRIVAVKAMDDNGQRILTEVEVKNDELEVAVEKICSQALKDKQNRKETFKKPVLSIEATNQAQPRMEEKLLEKMDRGLQKAWQTQKQMDRITHSIKNKVEPKENKSRIILNDNRELPSLNTEKEIEAETLEEQIKNVDDQVNSFESKIKNHGDEIDLDKQLKNHKTNSDLEIDISKEKDNLEQKDSRSDKDDEL